MSALEILANLTATLVVLVEAGACVVTIYLDHLDRRPQGWRSRVMYLAAVLLVVWRIWS